jgi:hypothetical protein
VNGLLLVANHHDAAAGTDGGEATGHEALDACLLRGIDPVELGQLGVGAETADKNLDAGKVLHEFRGGCSDLTYDHGHAAVFQSLGCRAGC